MQKAIILLFILNILSSFAQPESYCTWVPQPTEEPCHGYDAQSCIDCVNCAAEQGRYNFCIDWRFCYGAEIDGCQLIWS